MHAMDLVKMTEEARLRAMEQELERQRSVVADYNATLQARLESIPEVLETLKTALSTSAKFGNKQHQVSLDESAYVDFEKTPFSADQSNPYSDPVLRAIVDMLRGMGLKLEPVYRKKRFSKIEADLGQPSTHRYYGLQASWNHVQLGG